MPRLLFFMILIVSHMSAVHAQNRYEVRYHLADKDTLTDLDSLGLQHVFSSKQDCVFYMDHLVTNRRSSGYLSFSIDRIVYGATRAEAWIHIGEKLTWTRWEMSDELRSVADDAGLLHLLNDERPYSDSISNLFREKILNWMENNGYPFASIGIDRMMIVDQQIHVTWVLRKGPLYKIDSIRTDGNAKISKHFLHQYLGIPPGSIYRKDRLDLISSRLRDLSFLEEASPWNMSLAGTGSTLNLYLQKKRSSRINALVGFLPANDQLRGKTLITGDVNIYLQNAVGRGETIGLNWQQLQIHSPRLNILYQHPFLFRSGYGIDLQLEVFRKDSSFINIHFLSGVNLQVEKRGKGKVFFQRLVSNLIAVDTNLIKRMKALPEQLDVRSSLLGIDYQYAGTDYAFNPRKGMEAGLTLSAGIRRIQKNNFIASLSKDASGLPYSFSTLYDSITLKSYILRARMFLARYVPTGKRSTVRIAVTAGLIGAKGVYRNELFQIGGYKLLRGFDEESVYTDRFLVTSAEYRYLIGERAYLYAFSDLGFARTMQATAYYWGNGLGVSLETKAGLLNLSYAVGKEEKSSFSFRQGKIHIGFVSIF